VPRDSADYKAACAFGAAHGYSEIKTEKFAALLHYQDPQNRVDYLNGSPEQISMFLDLVPTNADGTFNLAIGQRLMDERFRAPAFPNDPDAGNRFRNNSGDAGRDFLGGPDIARAPDIPRAGAGQGAQDYANEMTMAAPDYGFSYDYDDRSNTYDSPDSTYDDPGSPPQIDFDPLPSLPPVDSNGPMMLPPPDIRLDRELAPIPNIGVEPGGERTPAPQGADAGQTFSSTAPGTTYTTAPGDSARGDLIGASNGQNGGVSGSQSGNGTTASDTTADASGPLYGFNTDGQPLLASGSRPSQGEYRAAPDAPNLMAGDPVLRADATGATPLRDENGTLYYRVNGGAMDGQIIYVQPTTPTASLQNEQPATTLETGGTADLSGDSSLGFAPLAAGSTATTRLAGQLASQVLAAEMEFGPPQLRLAAAATLTGVALWAAGRQNTEYEALSPEERDLLRQPPINVPLPPLPPLPGLVPPPVPDNSTLPGTSTQTNNLPPLGGFQIAPPLTIDDLIIESSRTPNGSARANGYDYEFDGNSRIDNVEGDLNLEDGTRNRTHQSGAGGADRLPDDDGGHIVGNRFNPPGEEFNYVAQNSNFNRGSYRQLENEWAQLLADGHTVHVRWDFEYSGDSQRPDGFNVTYNVDDGEPVVRQFQNRHGGK
jgi:DNA/RNA non-specific endonuclease